ncbi:S1 RNA-binding domain-containing protein [archaeon]|jgi:translation initiation factor 2 subunit 1|nr:S1 RNA-binding domain-containing protein [archaeon]MBT6698044.1 S1 RNA-binding domain-containing protein [archaeon]
MLYRKTTPVKEGEIVLCKVTKIFHSSVFAEIIEHGNKSGMIHISEIAPGRIRNLRDYVKEGKQIICVILRINKERGHIDLSLRRVGSNQQREKLEQIKQELKAEKVIAKLAGEMKLKSLELYKKISPKILEEYDYIHDAFKEVVSSEVTLEELGVDKEIAEKLTLAVKDRFKEPIALLKGDITLKTYEPNGIDKIKTLLAKVQTVREDLNIKYMGAGKYNFTFKDKDIQHAEKDLAKMEKIVMGFSDGKINTSAFDRQRATMEEQ